MLLDSHVFLWLLYEPKKLGRLAQDIISAEGTVCISIVTLWELSLKYSIGKLPYSPQELNDGLEAAGVELLQLNPSHILSLESVDMPHKDPFDQLLVAQSQAENYIFVTADKNILSTSYRTLDATQ